MPGNPLSSSKKNKIHERFACEQKQVWKRLRSVQKNKARKALFYIKQKPVVVREKQKVVGERVSEKIKKQVLFFLYIHIAKLVAIYICMRERWFLFSLSL